MSSVNLKPFLRPNLDVLFVALNPPEQSNANGHYFSGKGSRFFHLLYLSGLLISDVPKNAADDMVFGSTAVTVGGLEFGVVDLMEEVVETSSARVRPERLHVDGLVSRVRTFDPRYVCVIHSKVRDALNASGCLVAPLSMGVCGALLPGSPAIFVMNYFPNGNGIRDNIKLQIFRELRDELLRHATRSRR